MSFGSHVYFFLQRNEPVYYRILLGSKYSRNPDTWNVVYRVCTERALLRSLREWDQRAWCQYLGWGLRTNWETMYSVIAKLTGLDKGCLEILFETFALENIKYVFYEIRDEKNKACAHLNKKIRYN